MRTLAGWLPKGRTYVLVGDRGFRGMKRLRAWEAMGYSFVVRVVANTKIDRGSGWRELRSMAPAKGKGWRVISALVSTKYPMRLQVVALRIGLPKAKEVRNYKGHRTGATTQEATWYLVSDLPQGWDIARIYARRMEIEETFRDLKSLFGLETEQTERPEERLSGLMTAMMLGEGLSLAASGARLEALPRWRSEALTIRGQRYPSESRTREGLHRLWVAQWQGALREDVRAIWRKGEQMQKRPQVCERRRSEPAVRWRTRRSERTEKVLRVEWSEVPA